MNKPAAAKIALPLHETECDGTYYVESADHKGVCITDDTVLALGERAYVAESAAKVNAQTIRDQQARIRELEATVAIAKNNVKHANDAIADEAARNERLTRLVAKMDEVLQECAEYFDGKADADTDSDGVHPNREMRLLTSIREVRS